RVIPEDEVVGQTDRVDHCSRRRPLCILTRRLSIRGNGAEEDEERQDRKSFKELECRTGHLLTSAELIFFIEEVGTETGCFFERLLVPPCLDTTMIAAQKYLRHLHIAIACRFRVPGDVEESILIGIP